MNKDELSNNHYYYLLKEKYRRKFESALEACHLICIPITSSLNDVQITEDFIDHHILQPDIHDSKVFHSTDSAKSNSYRLVNKKTLVLIEKNNENKRKNNPEIIKIESIETGFNQKHQKYFILVVNRSISPKFQKHTSPVTTLPQDTYSVNRIESLKDSFEFLTSFPKHEPLVKELDIELQNIKDNAKTFLEDVLDEFHDSDPILVNVRELIQRHWVAMLRIHPFQIQKDSKFQHILSMALENYITSHLHPLIFRKYCDLFYEEDQRLYKHILAVGSVTANQLGGKVELSVPTPAAVVELATLDSLTSPLEKLGCIRACLELIRAEIKGAICEAKTLSNGTDTENANNSCPFELTQQDLTASLAVAIVKCKPLYLATNLYYIERYQWSLQPHDTLSCSLETFKNAVENLFKLRPENFLKGNIEVPQELALEDFIRVTDRMSARFDPRRRRPDPKTPPSDLNKSPPPSPLECHLARVIDQMQQATVADKEHSSYEKETIISHP